MVGFAPKGHAKVDPLSPAAFAICDMCGFQYNHRDLRWEVQYRGTRIERTGYLVCPVCWDAPNPTLRPFNLPADPSPILNPRSEKQEVFFTSDTTKITCDDTKHTVDSNWIK